MIRKYETMFIVNPSLTEEERTTQIEAVKTILDKHEATIKAEYSMGTRSLAYTINKFDRGYYHVIYFEAPTAAINFLEKFYKVNETIFRFIVVKYESKLEIKTWENMVKKALGEKVEEKTIKTRERSNYKKPYDRNSNNKTQDKRTFNSRSTTSSEESKSTPIDNQDVQ